MKNIFRLLSIALIAQLVIIGCDSEDDLIEERIQTLPPDATFTAGTADFSNYISIGNSLTAGFMDAALYTDGQNNSFPNIIGGQIETAGLGGAFNQPDINAVNGFNTTLNSDPTMATFGKFVLDVSIPGPVPTTPGDLITAYAGDKSALNNFGVPGVRLGDLTDPSLAISNGLYARFATAPGTSTIMSDALATNPTFFTLWIGNNDVLGFAVSGGSGENPLDVYSQAEFQADYAGVIGQLLGAGAKGVVINIPPVLSIPFLRAVPWNALPLDAATATAADGGYVAYNGGLQAALNADIIDQDEFNLRVIDFVEGQNGFIIEDDELTDVATLSGGMIPIPKLRQTKASDLIPLSAASVLGTLVDPTNPASVRGVGVALGDQFALTLQEQVAIITASATYNAIIDGIAAATPGVELYDIQPAFADIAGLTPTQAAQLALTPAAQAAADGVLGIEFEGSVLAPDFSPNGVYSTDGVHPNPRGHALVANQLIDLINARFESNIPKVNSTTFRTVILGQ